MLAVGRPVEPQGHTVALEFTGYRVLSQIGVGARSTINQVVRNTTGQFFALKRVLRRNADDDRFLQQVENEYRVSSQVDHPALRKSFQIHRKKKWLKVHELLLLMEHVPGKTLEQDRPTDVGDAVTLAREIARGLHALHEMGFVHADIKPNNIIRTEDGGIKIIDFGQSCPIGHKKERIQGTPDYIAPEQVRKLPLDRRTDIFNLGATLYWMLTGRTYPTDIRSPAKPGGHEIKTPKRAPKDLVPNIPAALSQLVMDCCREAPDKRPENMEQVIARLDVADKMWQKHMTANNTGETDTPPAAD